MNLREPTAPTSAPNIKGGLTVSKGKKSKGKAEKPREPIARAADIHYGLPLDEDDWEARKRMEAADRRAMKDAD